MKISIFVPGEGLSQRTITLNMNTTAKQVIDKVLGKVPYLQCLYQYNANQHFELCELHRSGQDTVLGHKSFPLRNLLKWSSEKIHYTFRCQSLNTVSLKPGFFIRIKSSIREAHILKKTNCMRTTLGTTTESLTTVNSALKHPIRSRSTRSLRSLCNPNLPAWKLSKLRISRKSDTNSTGTTQSTTLSSSPDFTFSPVQENPKDHKPQSRMSSDMSIDSLF